MYIAHDGMSRCCIVSSCGSVTTNPCRIVLVVALSDAIF